MTKIPNKSDLISKQIQQCVKEEGNDITCISFHEWKSILKYSWIWVGAPYNPLWKRKFKNFTSSLSSWTTASSSLFCLTFWAHILPIRQFGVCRLGTVQREEFVGEGALFFCSKHSTLLRSQAGNTGRTILGWQVNDKLQRQMYS